MNKSRTITGILMLILMLSASGCGSIHIGGTSHTHFYANDKIDADDADIDGIAHYIKFIKERMNAEAEPMKDFRWTDKTKEKAEDDRF